MVVLLLLEDAFVPLASPSTSSVWERPVTSVDGAVVAGPRWTKPVEEP